MTTVAVYGDTFIILLDDRTSNEIGEDAGVPPTMCVNLACDAGPVSLLIGQPGSFVDISIRTGSLLCMVTGVKMTESFPKSSEIKEAFKEGDFFLSSAKRLLEATAVGTIDIKGKFEKGSDILPTVGADVFAVPSETIEKVYASFSKGNFSIGKLSALPNQEAKINLDAFLCRHAAILGQTGSGKCQWSSKSAPISVIEKCTSRLAILGFTVYVLQIFLYCGFKN